MKIKCTITNPADIKKFIEAFGTTEPGLVEAGNSETGLVEAFYPRSLEEVSSSEAELLDKCDQLQASLDEARGHLRDIGEVVELLPYSKGVYIRGEVNEQQYWAFTQAYDLARDSGLGKMPPHIGIYHLIEGPISPNEVCIKPVDDYPFFKAEEGYEPIPELGGGGEEAIEDSVPTKEEIPF